MSSVGSSGSLPDTRRLPVGLAGAAGLLALAFVTALELAAGPWPDTPSATGRAAIETATVLATGFAACLLYVCARAGGRGRELAVAWGAGLFALVEGAFVLGPEIVSLDVDGGVLRADCIARLVVVAALTAGALAPAKLTDRAGRTPAYAMWAALLAIPILARLIGAVVPLDAAAALATVRPPSAQVVLHLLAVPLAALAGVAVVRRAGRGGSELQAWVAGAVLLLGLAELGAGLNPVLTQEWITTGDGLRCAAALLLLAGALRQLRSAVGPGARRAVTRERRRIALELHDGLAQELAYIAAHAPRIAAASQDPAAARIAEAAACALEESRLAISSLSHEPRSALGATLVRAAEQIATRADAVVRVERLDAVEVETVIYADLVRIVREATTNAVRHGAREVTLSLAGGDQLVLTIADDGSGFRQADDEPGLYSGYGLSGMRERAERAGGRLRIRSEPGRGTVLEVHIA
jgi:signal transduction histidine kinase